VGGSLPTFDQVVSLIRSPKPPLACRVVELRYGVEGRSARVLFDGISSWFIESDERIEFRHSDDLALFDEGNKLRRLGPNVRSHSNGWAKTPIEGNRMILDQATGRVIGLEDVDGRRSVLAEFHGLRSGEDTVFQLHIDLDTGLVLRMTRTDLGPILRLEHLRIGSVEEAP
jgi:hypothetical protein